MTTWRARYIARRNAVIGNPSFQRWSARIPGIRWLARRRAGEMFDLVAGFAYSRVLLAVVESGLLELLETETELGAIAEAIGLERDAALRLLRAAEALDLTEESAPGRWMLGEQGAALSSNRGVQAMVRHHRLLYQDIADPLALLRQNRKEPTELSRYWSYAGALHGHADRGGETAEYSELMATSQHFVAEQVLDSMSFQGTTSLLDVGGGHGAFLSAIGEAHPHLRLGLFDLSEVVEGARPQLAGFDETDRLTLHPGNFFEDDIPGGYDLVSLVRILHDHDDTPALDLLRKIRASLSPGDRLLIAEPMSGVRGAEAMGDAFFGMYLWAMGSGRPRRPSEITAMLRATGFARSRVIDTPQPVIASVIVAFA